MSIISSEAHKKMINLNSSLSRDGRFIVGIHRPAFDVANFRKHGYVQSLGRLDDGTPVENHANFPAGDVHEPGADLIYEIANAFPFRGVTYINSAWADAKAARPDTIGIARPSSCSFLRNLGDRKDKNAILELLPHPLKLALAQASTDPEELIFLAHKSCQIILEPASNSPTGIVYKKDKQGRTVPNIYDHELFEVLVNNRYLPDVYKNALVLKPGVQGSNEIIGEYLSDDGSTHVFEYLRRNSYIPWGHFASNMANDSIRYRAEDLTENDMKGIRHLYYQRIFSRIAAMLGLPCSKTRDSLSVSELETLRLQILKMLQNQNCPAFAFNASLWGWNFGFGYAQSGHRLHASHQMIHQQNAMIPESVPTLSGDSVPSFACGDLVRDFIRQFYTETGQSFFETYIMALRNNTRIDGNTGPASLIIAEDEHTILFVPKAQISEWEVQLMPKTACGNIVEADKNIRLSLDKGILTAVKVLEALGAQFVTGIEFSKRFDAQDKDHHLLYSFIPRLPYAPATFSEAQLRWISGCYPEDFALACRNVIKTKGSYKK
jgi:hypothetical protein